VTLTLYMLTLPPFAPSPNPQRQAHRVTAGLLNVTGMHLAINLQPSKDPRPSCRLGTDAFLATRPPNPPHRTTMSFLSARQPSNRTAGQRPPRRTRDGSQTVIEPPTFRFSEVWITVRRIPLTSTTCIAALIRTPMNAGERRRMRPKMRPPGLGCLTETATPTRAG
jgi:hypothetical protein